ncbi:MAG: aldehyde dehydrogenase family protein [Actinobacteria bacterium]|nr:aldehyde dehydrogenase family protein [Actinomycetota bacterium]
MTSTSSSKRFDVQWIDGQWTPSSADDGITVVNPTDEQVIAEVPAGTRGDVDRAVAAARRASERWAGTPLTERLAFLERLVGRLTTRSEEFANDIVAEVGAPLAVARQAQVGLAIALAASYLDIGREFGYERRVGNSRVVREPVGVVATITPWNVPLLLTLQKIVPALVAGCTVVHKPSEVTPLYSYLLAEVVAECDLPAGVFNMVVGTGPEVGAELARHPGVDLISLTGSTRAGRDVIRNSADTVKRVHLELGGKNASVVLDDADLDRAVRATVDQACFNTGQTCLQWSRLLVPRDRAGAAARIAAEVAATYRIGDPRLDTTDLGPLVSAAALERVTGYIRSGIEEGAELVAGGAGRPAGTECGYFVEPTIFAGVDPAMTVARAEIFGPVISIMPYDTTDDAIRIANDTDYGLHGAVWSGSDDHARQVARRIRTGVIDINGGTFNIAAPFGGVKQSGYGRECGVEGLDGFLETKSIQEPATGPEVTGPRLRETS